MRNFIFCIIIILFSCDIDHDRIDNFIDHENLATEELTDPRIYYTENGNMKVKVETTQMKRFSETEDILDLSGNVSFNFYR